MSPSDYIQSRHLAAQSVVVGRDQLFFMVDGRPYLPNFAVDASSSAAASTSSVTHAALAIVAYSIYTAVTSTPNRNIENIRRSGSLAVNESKLKPISMSIDWDAILLSVSIPLECATVTGGITNALFRVSGFEKVKPVITGVVAKLLENNGCGEDSITLLNSNVVDALLDFDSVLVRIFGAEGMIDRDVETATYAALCDANIAYRYLGRFKNGRIEGWLDGFQALTCADLALGHHSVDIAKGMARLHCLFQLPKGELRDHHYGTDENAIKVGLWDQLSSWMEQAKGYTEFRTQYDTDRVRLLELDKIELEVQYFISFFASDSSDVDGAKRKRKIVFCHNDLLPANIMFNNRTKQIQFIDFEYGGVGYAAYDIANHFNEYAGGTSAEDNGVPDYSRFPRRDKQKTFCEEYVREVMRYVGEDSGMECNQEVESQEVDDFLDDIQKFLLVNHLYWGLWAVNQAAEEGCDGFDYVSFATNRFKQFYAMKAT